ncbi:hypothetical protein [Mycolicibacterium sp. CR10]|uniref:hypothetical protein n=1 Tax=Mycolicibacterium sp. CR10 TaxID=2562314 RepID=UPI001F0FAA69|nr:hypothetical protein [Mycolicibacterium sp. CR10]
MAEQDVQHESDTVGEGEDEPEWLAFQTRIREHEHAAEGKDERQDIATSTGSDGGQNHRAEELDGPDGRERETFHREVEQRVHRGQDETEREEHPALRPSGLRPQPARAAPQGKNDRRRDDPQPGDTERGHVDEEQDSQRRTQVVKQRAGQKVGRRWEPGHGAHDAAGTSSAAAGACR